MKMNIAVETKELTDPAAKRFSTTDWSLVVLLLVATCALYFRSIAFNFVDFDDEVYVSSNVHVLQGITLSSLRWAMGAQVNGNWHPLTYLTQIFIAGIFGVKPWAYHAVNMLLHALNVVLLYVFFRRSTGRMWPAFFTALLWGLHPQRVESVAWITELKDVMYGVFWLGCMIAYQRYSTRRTALGLAWVTLLQGLSLLGKPMAVTLPCALLLLDYWPLRSTEGLSGEKPSARWWFFRVLEKLPMLALSILDICHQKNVISFSRPGLPWNIRIENGLISYALYVRDAFFPYHLGIFYPHPAMFRQMHQPTHIPWIPVAISTMVLTTITVAVLMRLKRQPYLAVGWFWFLGTLVPVIGLTQVGEQARADRFTYLPSIGLFMAVVWCVSDLCANQLVRQRAAAVAGSVLAAILLLVSYTNLGYWKDTNTLFGHLRQIDPRNYLAMAVECDHLSSEGHLAQAIALGKQAVEISPASPRAHNSYGNALRLAGDYEKAGEQLQISTKLDPDESATWDTLGRVRDAQAGLLAGKNDPMENKYRRVAIVNFRNAIQADPDEVVARDHLAFQLALTGKLDEAISVWKQALALSPRYAQAHGDLADALLLKGDQPGAIQQYELAIADGGDSPQWETKLAYLIATSPQATDAEVQPMISIARDACEQTKNQDPAALDAYAACLARASLFDPAIKAAQQGINAANAIHNPAVAVGIKKHLAFYLKNEPFIASAETTQPATTRANEP
jgi:tetratricopeptide (TPR) repeat protein